MTKSYVYLYPKKTPLSSLGKTKNDYIYLINISSRRFLTINNNHLKYLCVDGSWKVITGFWFDVVVGPELFTPFGAKKPENLFVLAVNFLKKKK